MSGRYYELARLRAGRSAEVSAHQLAVNLDAVGPGDMVCNDHDLQQQREPGDFLYVSGGGSLLLSKRFLLILQRETSARVHPGKFSLFTGRSDNLPERRNPALLCRELFEELHLYRAGRLLWPVNPGCQDIIDRAYVAHGLRREGAEPSPINARPMATRPLAITCGGETRRLDLTWHVSSRGDINVLQIYSADLEPDELTARDGEGLDRTIWAYDLASGRAQAVGYRGMSRQVTPADMTEHLQFVIESLSTHDQAVARAS